MSSFAFIQNYLAVVLSSGGTFKVVVVITLYSCTGQIDLYGQILPNSLLKTWPHTTVNELTRRGGIVSQKTFMTCHSDFLDIIMSLLFFKYEI